MLLELTVAEQRFNAVMEVLRDGLTVIEVADRYGVSRQTIHGWLRRYRTGGLDALADRSHRPNTCPHQMPAAVEAHLCELRRRHPHWGPAPPGPRACPGRRRPAARADQHLPGPGPQWAYPAQGPATPEDRLPTLGTSPADGAVAAGRHGRDLASRWPRAQGGDRHRRPLPVLRGRRPGGAGQCPQRVPGLHPGPGPLRQP